MRNITLIPTMHIEISNCNRHELIRIFKKLQPEIIFEEFDEPRTKNYEFGNTEHTVETFAIINYLKKYPILHIPVDAYKINVSQEDIKYMYNIIGK